MEVGLFNTLKKFFLNSGTSSSNKALSAVLAGVRAGAPTQRPCCGEGISAVMTSPRGSQEPQGRMSDLQGRLEGAQQPGKAHFGSSRFCL